MVIYQKQHRLAHRQYCVPLSESRLTRFPPPSKKAFFPSSHIFHVNSKCIIKTLFSSKCSSINFRDSLRFKGRDEKTSAPERGAGGAELRPPSPRSLRGHRSAPPAAPSLPPLSAWSSRAKGHPAGHRAGHRAGHTLLPAVPGAAWQGGKRWLPPQHPDLERWVNGQVIPIPASPAFSDLVAYATCSPAEQSRWCPELC